MTNMEEVWKHFLLKKITFWNLDLSSNTQSKETYDLNVSYL